MAHHPHPDETPLAVSCAIISISDTRTPESDRSGQLMQKLLTAAGHRPVSYTLLKDEPQEITQQVVALAESAVIGAILLNGGTGIAPRDTTYDAIAQLIEKPLPGFGELFRWLSYQDIGSRAIASRAIAGTYRGKLIFSLPGSTNAVQLGMEKLILPELTHLVRQVSGR
jgi:molybdenum cofactor biosynthesis protein B